MMVAGNRRLESDVQPLKASFSKPVTSKMMVWSATSTEMVAGITTVFAVAAMAGAVAAPTFTCPLVELSG